MPFLTKSVELLSLYELKENVDEDFEVDVIVYAEHKEGSFVFGNNLKTCDKVSMEGLCSELETLDTELNWKKFETHMENYEIKQVGILHLCRGEKSILWEAKSLLSSYILFRRGFFALR